LTQAVLSTDDPR